MASLHQVEARALSPQAQRAMKEANALGHHVAHCYVCQTVIVDTLLNDRSSLAGELFARIMNHHTENCSHGRV